MTQAIVPKELLTATLGGLSLLVVSGGADGHVLTQQADGTYAPEAPASGGITGSVGSTDNRIPRSDGTGGTTLQASGITVDDSNNVTGAAAITAAGIVTSSYLSGVQQGRFCGPNSTFLYFDQFGQIALADSTKTRFGITGVDFHLASDGVFGISSGNVFGSVDLKLSRSSTGPTWDSRAAGGFRSRNLANSADAPLSGSRLTLSDAIVPASLANASAPNNSIYYSTDAAKLVYKDAGGTVNNLY